MLRVYRKDRHLHSIQENIKKYILSEVDIQGNTHIRMPTVDNVMQANVIVTTVSTSLALVNLHVKGYFTHIFIDEAGQTEEPQLLKPLSLATQDTCIVLAGDVLQMSPQVYNPEASSLKVSLLQRIFDRYETHQRNTGSSEESRHTVFLTKNYRNDRLILKFLSSVIYGHDEKLVWRSGINSSCGSLRLHIVQGQEQPGTGASFFNLEEAFQVGQALLQLTTNWPVEWGPMDLYKIVVTAMYTDQVSRFHLV